MLAQILPTYKLSTNSDGIAATREDYPHYLRESLY